MRHADATGFDGMILWFGSLAGPTALPGKYLVELVIGSDTLTQTFEIVQDPRSDATVADLEAQLDFINSINTKISEAHQAIIDIRGLTKGLTEVKTKVAGLENLDSLLQWCDHLANDLIAIEKTLYQTQNRSNQDPLNFPIRLTNKLAYLNTISRGGSYGPTNQAIEVREELTAAIDEQLNQLQALIDTRLSAINEAYRSLQLDVLQVGSK